ncbi:50S ribosomal protein L23 [Anaerolineae bacterium CFX9]|jgi:large subunit ribosomal protein L23|nr:50S ribosomal protein L23 [Anaerolineae bacterium CFX9]
MNLYDVLIRPVVTEKSNMLSEQSKYVFEVAMNANKRQIKEAIETIFDKKVVKVNTMIMPAKRGQRGRRTYMRTSQWKKAIVTLADGETLEIFNA